MSLSTPTTTLLTDGPSCPPFTNAGQSVEPATLRARRPSRSLKESLRMSMKPIVDLFSGKGGPREALKVESPTWWIASPSQLERLRVPVRVPRAAVAEQPNACLAEHRDSGWVCTRRLDHGRRHAAALSSGEVLAVWP